MEILLIVLRAHLMKTHQPEKEMMKLPATDPMQQNRQTTSNRSQVLKLKDLQPGTKITAPDGTAWTVMANGQGRSGRCPSRNVFTEQKGPSAYEKRNISQESYASAWRLLITEQMLKKIQKCTETEARNKTEDPNWSVTLDELDAFLAILYVRGALLQKGQDVHDLWSMEWGTQFYKDAMSRNRFSEILRYLRFDLRESRSRRSVDDKFGLISEIWNAFIQNCQDCYIPGPYLTIDEQLFPSKARCRFTQFMASKPDKYGQKKFHACR